VFSFIPEALLYAEAEKELEATMTRPAAMESCFDLQVSALVSSPIPEALLYAQAEKEYQAKLLELVQKGLARPEDVEKQLTQEGLEAFIESE
jgi:hypothetical protein